MSTLPLRTASLFFILLLTFGCPSGTNLIPPNSNGSTQFPPMPVLNNFPANKLNISISSMAEEVSKLPKMQVDTVESYARYQDFVDKTNALIQLLNREGKLNIGLLDKSYESWGKISNAITKYAPLIKSYNEIIDSAQAYHEGDNAEKRFITAIGVFGVETALVVSITAYS